ncbi:MAG: DUF2484 family protein [Rhodobacteraceae bacterium]|nr:DUF2484 family protein [Paracoccaceae bacterium]
MSPSLILGCLWVFTSAIVAMLPMRRQYAPGIALLFAAPALIGVIWWEHGVWVGLAALFAFVSMFRNPLRYLWKRLRGEKPELPK